MTSARAWWLLLGALALDGCGGPPTIVPIDADRQRPDVGPIDAFVVPEPDAALDPSVDADLDAPIVPEDAHVVSADAFGAPSMEALTMWTSTDVIEDATTRARAIAADAALVWIEAEDVRADGTIDLTEGAASDGRWTLLFTSASTMQTISITYEEYDTGAAWPSVTTPTYMMRVPMDLSLAPDSATFHATYRDAGCTPAGMLIDANLSPLSLDASMPLYLRLASGGNVAEHEITAGGTMLRAGSGCL